MRLLLGTYVSTAVRTHGATKLDTLLSTGIFTSRTPPADQVLTISVSGVDIPEYSIAAAGSAVEEVATYEEVRT